MSVYRKFDRNDILFSTVHTRPKVSVNFGEGGWRGSTGVSASLSLYGGIRGRRDVKSSDFNTTGISLFPLDPVDTHSIDKVIYVSGSYPSTGSIRYVRCKNITQPSDPTETRWYEEHYRPIELLHSYYSRYDTNYFLGSHDFYTPLLLVDSSSPARPGPHFIFSGTFAGRPVHGSTSSFTVEAWVKPLPIGTSSLAAASSSLMSQQDTWAVFVNSQNQLAVRVSTSLGVPATASAPAATIEPGVWTHVAVVFSASVSASFWLNGALADSVAIPSTGLQSGSGLYPLVVGAMADSNGSTWGAGWNGFIGETRVWGRALTQSEIATNLSGTLIASASSDLYHYARYNDGPYGVKHGFVSGSGAFDYSPSANHGRTRPWSTSHQVHWTPSDHPTFRPVLSASHIGIPEIRVVHVPSMFYGRQIDPGSVTITDGTYNRRHVVRVISDDGRGTLYISGSMTKSISGEDYTGETRRKVGNVFYTEGLMVITDPALFDMFDSGGDFWDPAVEVSGVFGDLLAVDFRGQGRINTKVFNCRLPTAQINASNNPTFSQWDSMGTVETDDDRLELVRDDGVTYITAIGLYNEDRQLVAVAKLAQPIRKREKDRQNIRLKIDF